MKTFTEFVLEAKKGRCWTGYKPVPGKEPYSPDSCEKIKEDGMGAGAVSAGPTNVVGGGAIAGTGGKGGEPGVNPKKKKSPVLLSTLSRKPPKM